MLIEFTLSLLLTSALPLADAEVLHSTSDAITRVEDFNKQLWDEGKHLYRDTGPADGKKASAVFSSQNNGRILKTTAELLYNLNPQSEEFERVLGYFGRQVSGLVQYQAKSGMWRQVLNQASSGDDVPGSALFAAVIAKGICSGWIDVEYSAAATKAWETLKNKKATDNTQVLSCEAEILKLKDFMNSRNFLWTRPSFCSCSVEFDCQAPVDNAKLEYRKDGETEWSEVRELPFYTTQPGYRTSILRLEEDSAYECRLTSGSKTLASSRFFTWKSDVKIGKTIVIDQDSSFPIKIDAKGKPYSWIKYTVAPGTVLKNKGKAVTMLVDDAEYVIIEGIKFEGPVSKEGAIHIQNSKGVRVRNCEITGWGRNAPPGYDQLGKPVENGKRVNFDGAIRIKSGASETVIERCYIHQPAGRSNSWYYSHPAGNEAIMLHKPDHSTVIRYNSFVGSDLHRFNDAVESDGNFHEDGGINRDADVYGNFMAFCNDDCIELDGGQRNVRCFDNRFEAALVGVSIQGCMVSPSFVFDNFMSGMCEEFGLAGQTVKTGGGSHGPEAKTFLWGNLMWGKGSGFTMMETLEAHLSENVFCNRAKIHGEGKEGSVTEKNLIGVKFKENELPVAFPISPCPFLLSEARKTEPSDEYTVTVSALPELTGKVHFKVCKDSDLDWFSVSPSEGELLPEQSVPLTLRLDRGKMNDRRDYRGAFIVRDDNGYSRPFTFYCETSFKPAFNAEKKGTTAVYVDPFKPASGTPEIIEDQIADGGRSVVIRAGSKAVLKYEFSVPKAGRYYFLIRGNNERDPKIDINFDGQGWKRSSQKFQKKYCTWSVLAPGWSFNAKIVPFDLVPGTTYSLSLRSEAGNKYDIPFCGLVITDGPGDFEPR